MTKVSVLYGLELILLDLANNQVSFLQNIKWCIKSCQQKHVPLLVGTLP